MKSCRTASIVAAVPILFVACHEAAKPDVAPVTTAAPASAPPPVASSAPSPSASASAQPPSSNGHLAAGVVAAFMELPPGRLIADDFCGRHVVAVVNGKITVGADTLEAGDVIVLGSPQRQEISGKGLLVYATTDMTEPCVATARPAETRAIVRGKDTKRLDFAKGKMHAWLDVDKAKSPELYLGRLEGTAAVPEHDHPTSMEILAAVEGAGTFVLEGKEQRLGPKQVVKVPAGAKHQWKPDPGSKLVAIQMYWPPGPEQRFVALDAAEKDAGSR